MKEISISPEGMTWQSLHSFLREVLDFPDYYGENLDALYDCLTDISEPVTLILAAEPIWEASLGEYGVSMLRAFEDAADSNDDLTLKIEE